MNKSAILTFHAQIFNGYQVIVPSWHTISLHSYKSLSTCTVCVHCAVTIAFLFIYAHFLNCTWGVKDITFKVGVCICVCMHETREKEKEKEKEKGRGRKRKCVYLIGHTS